jgi:hypothetical protein
MDTAEVREAFRSFVGDECFRKFVRALNSGRPDRLLYWQEELWHRFASEQPATIPRGRRSVVPLRADGVPHRRLLSGRVHRDGGRLLPRLSQGVGVKWSVVALHGEVSLPPNPAPSRTRPAAMPDVLSSRLFGGRVRQALSFQAARREYLMKRSSLYWPFFVACSRWQIFGVTSGSWRRVKGCPKSRLRGRASSSACSRYPRRCWLEGSCSGPWPRAKAGGDTGSRPRLAAPRLTLPRRGPLDPSPRSLVMQW